MAEREVDGVSEAHQLAGAAAQAQVTNPAPLPDAVAMFEIVLGDVLVRCADDPSFAAQVITDLAELAGVLANFAGDWWPTVYAEFFRGGSIPPSSITHADARSGWLCTASNPSISRIA